MPFTLYGIGGLILAVAILFGLLRHEQHVNGEISAELTTVKQERDDAKAQEKAAADATRQHDKELARLRKQAAGASASIARSADDGCLDRGIDPVALASLKPDRVQPKDGKAKPPAPSGRPPHP